MKLKKCRKCLIFKPFLQYYKHVRMLDGVINICKTCTKKRVKQYRINNINKIREYDRERGYLSLRKEKAKEYAHKNKGKLNQYKQKWRTRNKIKSNAHLKVKRALAKGILKKSKYCSLCESSNRIQAHHPDYSNPLNVVWVCSKCHGVLHRKYKK